MHQQGMPIDPYSNPRLAPLVGWRPVREARKSMHLVPYLAQQPNCNNHETSCGRNKEHSTPLVSYCTCRNKIVNIGC
jgi:hypothetical protein